MEILDPLFVAIFSILFSFYKYLSRSRMTGTKGSFFLIVGVLSIQKSIICCNIIPSGGRRYEDGNGRINATICPTLAVNKLFSRGQDSLRDRWFR